MVLEAATSARALCINIKRRHVVCETHRPRQPPPLMIILYDGACKKSRIRPQYSTLSRDTIIGICPRTILSHRRPQNPSIHFYCHKNRQKSIIFIAHTQKSIFQSILDLQRRKNPSIQSSFLSQRCKNPFISVAEVQKSRFHFCRTALKIHPSIWHTVRN